MTKGITGAKHSKVEHRTCQVKQIPQFLVSEFTPHLLRLLACPFGLPPPPETVYAVTRG